MLACPALLVALVAQNAPAPAPAPAVPPAQRPKLLERPSVRPSRAGDARQNYAQEVDPAPAAPGPSDQPAQDEAARTAATPDAAATAPVPQDAPPNGGPIRTVPSAVAPSTPQGALVPAAPAAGGRKPFPVDKLVPVAALAMLVGPAIGAIWFLGRAGGQPAE